MRNNYLTKEGHAELSKELRYLTEVRKPELAEKLRFALSQGDLKENADYHDAKEQLGFVEGRIRQLEYIRRNSIVVSSENNDGRIRVGSTVVILEKGEKNPEEYQIVGSAESNPRRKKLSVESPIGEALINKTKGQRIKIQVPDGTLTFKVLSVKG